CSAELIYTHTHMYTHTNTICAYRHTHTHICTHTHTLTLYLLIDTHTHKHTLITQLGQLPPLLCEDTSDITTELPHHSARGGQSRGGGVLKMEEDRGTSGE